MIKDSGERTEFESGAVRDCAEGKGRCDLVPIKTFYQMTGYDDFILWQLGEFQNQIKKEDPYILKSIFNDFIKTYFRSKYDAFLDLAVHFEEGAKKYSENNWKKGIPPERYLDSAVRHYCKFKRGDTDERHDRAFLWNILCCYWTMTSGDEFYGRDIERPLQV